MKLGVEIVARLVTGILIAAPLYWQLSRIADSLKPPPVPKVALNEYAVETCVGIGLIAHYNHPLAESTRTFKDCLDKIPGLRGKARRSLWNIFTMGAHIYNESARANKYP